MSARWRKMPPWVMHGWLVLADLLCACGNDRDALIARTDAAAAHMADGGDAGAPVGKPGDVIAHYADLGEGGACVECMRQNCSEAERACLADKACRDDAQQCAACRDPACNARCVDMDGDAWPLSVCMQASCSEVCAVGRNFECVGEYEWGNALLMPVAHIRLVQYTNRNPVPGAEVRACDSARPTCEGPPSVTTDDLGEAMLELVPNIPGRGFTGYVEILASGFDRVIWYPSAGNTEDVTASQLQLLTPATYADTYALNGYEDDPTLGSVIINASDCLGAPAPGLSFSASPPSVKPPDSPWYGYPPDVRKRQTEADGLGGIVYLAPGIEDITAVRAGTDDVVANARIWAHPGTRTWLDLKPFGKTQF